MKVLAVLLLCAFAAVQGRSAVLQKDTRTVAALGDYPYVLHLRLAVILGGTLKTCGGSLIDARWALTSSHCLDGSTFIWARYGVVNVINPSMVTETNTIVRNNEAALISINRYVQSTDNISPIGLSSVTPESATWCGFGLDDDGGPGESLSCYAMDLDLQDDGTITSTSDEAQATIFDLGSPLVADGAQVGMLVAAADDTSAGTFISLADYLEWIGEETGLDLVSVGVEPEPEVDSLLVKFVD